MRQLVALACILGALGCEETAPPDMAVAAMDAAVIVYDLAGRDLANGPAPLWYDLGSCTTGCDSDLGTCHPCCHVDSNCATGEKCLATIESDGCAASDMASPTSCPPGTIISSRPCFTREPLFGFGFRSCLPPLPPCQSNSDCPIGLACGSPFNPIPDGGSSTCGMLMGHSPWACGNCPPAYFSCPEGQLDFAFCDPPVCSSDADCVANQTTCIDGSCYPGGPGRCVKF
jgi:hypothetical protein